MAEPYLGEIRLFALGYAPQGWAPCQGQVLPINSYQALYSLLGSTYGGNGTTTFALPDLRGRVPLHVSSSFAYGTSGGEEAHTLTVAEMPKHTHQINGSSQSANATSPANNVWATKNNLYSSNNNFVNMHPTAVTSTGQSAPHNNMQPYVALNFCIALQGIFPSRN